MVLHHTEWPRTSKFLVTIELAGHVGKDWVLLLTSRDSSSRIKNNPCQRVDNHSETAVISGASPRPDSEIGLLLDQHIGKSSDDLPGSRDQGLTSRPRVAKEALPSETLAASSQNIPFSVICSARAGAWSKPLAKLFIELCKSARAAFESRENDDFCPQLNRD